jgi:hypothetical protein
MKQRSLVVEIFSKSNRRTAILTVPGLDLKAGSPLSMGKISLMLSDESPETE